MQELFMEAENILCRPGYSSIMDLYAMNKKAWLVATPGQTEQEYLARYMMEKGFRSQSQGDLDINAIMAAGPLPGWDHTSSGSGMFDRAVDDLIHRI
jgi:hypothetical protein